jgi:peroxiredoxin
MDTPQATRLSRRASSSSELAPATLDGWFVLHQLYRLDWALLTDMHSSGRRERLNELADLLDPIAGEGREGWSGAYRMTGGGVDLMLLHFRRTLDDLTTASEAVSLSRISDALLLDHEYLSVVELGMYGLTAAVAETVDPSRHDEYARALEEALAGERDKAHVRRRLYPLQPDDMPYVCYYPMDKRREVGQNWYSLPITKRAELMHAHGATGRRYAGQIAQVISGSTGLADWEWAVTLWAADPLLFKKIVTEMRYDEASAAYAEFGRFFVGRRISDTELRGWLP